MLRLICLLVLISPLEIRDEWLPVPVLHELRQAVQDWEIDSPGIYPVPLLQRCFWEAIWLPPAGDGFRFGHANDEAIQFSCGFIAYCRGQAELESWRAREWEGLISETEELQRVWRLAIQTRVTGAWVLQRRRALRDLRELIGDEAYEAGILPPVVPVWRFRVID